MRGLDENVVSCYMNSTAIPVMIGFCYATGGDLSAWRDYGLLEWFCLVALSISVIFSQTFRFKALQNEEASKLMPLQFLTPVYQLIADLALFAAVFDVWQLVGLSIVCGVFFFELIYNYYKSPATKPETSAEVAAAEPIEDNSFKKQDSKV